MCEAGGVKPQETCARLRVDGWRSLSDGRVRRRARQGKRSRLTGRLRSRLRTVSRGVRSRALAICKLTQSV